MAELVLITFLCSGNLAFAEIFVKIVLLVLILYVYVSEPFYLGSRLYVMHFVLEIASEISFLPA